MSPIPQNLLSYTTGCLARWRLPRPLATLANKGFAKAFGLNMSEAADPIGSYATVEELFTRKLKSGLRSFEGPVCSPADGYLAWSAPAKAGRAVQVKGMDYDLNELVLGTGEGDQGLNLAWYQTIYLAPHNYHRVHAPFSGSVTRITHRPGELWPVNTTFVRRVPRLFARNERLVFDFTMKNGGRAFVVMVGAFNVGRMVTPLAPDLITNSRARQLRPKVADCRFDTGRPVAIGDEIGTFMLGSTVVVVFDRDALTGFNLIEAQDNRPVLVGQSLCE
ncbi:MAG: phosphatidylserine decarboxylase [Deltaproteobacteria bacterium]|nr:phosphatidylserine decarboxylase [Deltaproteobacteria bacterium]